jgi:hypothetical protein
VSQLVKPDLYDPVRVHDACGFGFVALVDGRRTRETVEEGLEVLRNLDHRGASGSDPETGDGAGILLQIPDAFLRRECDERGIELPSAGAYERTKLSRPRLGSSLGILTFVPSSGFCCHCYGRHRQVVHRAIVGSGYLV